MKLQKPRQQRHKIYQYLCNFSVLLFLLSHLRQARSFSVSQSLLTSSKIPKQRTIVSENKTNLSTTSRDILESRARSILTTIIGTSNNSKQERQRRQKLATSITIGILSSILFLTSPQPQSSLLQGILQPPAAYAFDNGISDVAKYNNIPKHPGMMPTNLGIEKTNGKLAFCDGDAFNCFSTTGDESHLLQPWKPNGGTTKLQAMDQLVETIKSYPPGQARVDKAGFKIVTARSDYLYVQFESMKHGFIDDVEFAVTMSGSGSGSNKNNNDDNVQIQVRSASRIGFFDLGVNGKRLNWISNHLVETYGWKQTNKPIISESYPDYFPMIPFTYDDYIRSVLSPETCPVPANPLECKDPESGPA